MTVSIHGTQTVKHMNDKQTPANQTNQWRNDRGGGSCPRAQQARGAKVGFMQFVE